MKFAAVKKSQQDRFPRVLFQLKGSSVLAITKGDLTQWEGDAIVNAANERMLGGGGVDGAIHRAAGPELADACWHVKEVARNVRCPKGEARITPGFRLNAKAVIHTVGPVYAGHEKSAPILANSFKNSLLLLREKQLKTIAFPAISCGIYGYPPVAAAKVSIATILKFCQDIDLVEFVLFGQDTYDPFVAEASRVLETFEEPEEDDKEGADGNSRKHGAGDEHGASKAASVESSPHTSSTSEGKDVAEKGSSGGKLLSAASAGTTAEGADDGKGIAAARLKRGEGAEDAGQPEMKLHKDEQTTADWEQTAARQPNDPPTGQGEPQESAHGTVASMPHTKTEDRSDSADAISEANAGVSTAEVEIESQEDAIAMPGECSSEGGGTEATTSMETEEIQDSQETLLMEYSPEDTLTLPGESPSEGAGAEQRSCSSGDGAVNQGR